VHLITLSKPSRCISKSHIRSYRCEQDAQTERPWNRPVLDASTQVFVLSATTPCANHITSCSEWRHIAYSIRLQEAGATQRKITGWHTSVLRLVYIWKEKFERAEGSGPKKKRHSTARQEKRTYTKREMDKRFQCLSGLRPHLI